jgi:hypothetical protein
VEVGVAGVHGMQMGTTWLSDSKVGCAIAGSRCVLAAVASNFLISMSLQLKGQTRKARWSVACR